MMTGTDPQTPKQRPLLTYFVLAYAISWAFWLPLAASERGLLPAKLSGPVFYGLAAVGPLLAALIAAHREGGRTAVRPLLNGLLRWRVGFQWYAAAALAYPALTLLALAVDRLLGGAAPLVWPSEVLSDIHMPYWFLLILNPPFVLCEEIGWRGFALPRLQKRYSALVATLILGVLWALWHVPSFLMPESIHSRDLSFLPWAIGLQLTSIAITWLYNGTQGSVLHAWLYHVTMNYAGFLIPATLRARGIAGVLVIAAIVLIVILAGPRRLGAAKHTGTAPATSE